MVTPLSFLLGYLIDLIIGDPAKLPHPIRFIGKLINGCENILRIRERFLKIKGLILLLAVSLSSFLTVFFIIYISKYIHPYLGIVIESIFVFQILATKSLFTESNKVYKALRKGDLAEARTELTYLVTRDCDSMDEADIVRSTVETISENIVDGITSPMFYIALGGAPLGMFYKAVNTLDSMVGYKNSRYIDFGFFSAKFDDAINYIPARVSSLIIILSTLIVRKDFKRAYKILIRDRRNHNSPNSGYAEAPIAGALGIQLGGRVSYFGTIYEKEIMGDDIKNPGIADIRSTQIIMFVTSVLFFSFSIIVAKLLW